MSVKVQLEGLASALVDYTYAYLLTTGNDQRPHAVAVTPRLTDTDFRVDEPGRRTQTNIEDRPDVSLVFPPAQQGGYSLIVDGRASAADGQLVVVPASAVLHRAATPDTTPAEPGCTADCQRIPV
ncbi:hypothetical protein CLV47_11188 [Antricoccus suffuscus]|uniref:Pyridoxamine 5'-phosphate oxidase n=1 Tax=Antricoccus suffuscus TaxID=1629062 RepID=A0A2T0ZXX8_9ACTN|nr:hypothetical protein [Antricoccus suffuscus]PRZ41211.1 hypothetical protein CLV47_11188 [Antricoccus suffuscus]